MIDFQYVQVALFTLTGSGFFVLFVRFLRWIVRSLVGKR